MRVLTKTPLGVLDNSVATGWRELPENSMEIRDYVVWVRDGYNPIIDSSKQSKFAN